ncbi:DedA family protein [Paenibacillus sp. YYML68]|uniref:DedA family protein n=1 Tax=Paenibacillus sp. YYML68 TaxID=2909250 RepID=UPI00248FD42F|nr:DedA family protein [Paenibacillus sp. YYML68]
MEQWIISIIEQFGYTGILVLIALENVFPPIPSEVILSFSGFMTTRTDLTLAGVLLYATIGSVVGAAVLYGLGWKLGLRQLERIIERYGSFVRLTTHDLHRANGWFARYGLWTVFFCRFIPLIRSLISIPAGLGRISIGWFLLLTTIGSFIWNMIFIYLGAAAGHSWGTITG